MKSIELNCKVHLRFIDGEGVYVLTPFSISRQLNEISVTSPLGKALLGKKESEEISFLNSIKEEVKVKILKIETAPQHSTITKN